MKITEDVRKYLAEQGIAEEGALKKGMEEKSKEFVEKGRMITRKGEDRLAPFAFWDCFLQNGDQSHYFFGLEEFL